MPLGCVPKALDHLRDDPARSDVAREVKPSVGFKEGRWVANEFVEFGEQTARLRLLRGCHVRDALTNRKGFDALAQLVNVAVFLKVEDGYLHPAVGFPDDETLALQLPQSLSHRNPADIE